MQNKENLPLKSLLMSVGKSLDNSWDARGVNDLLWLDLSSSRKCEEGDDFLLENSAIRAPIAASTPKAIPTIAAPLMTDLPPRCFLVVCWSRTCGVPGGGAPLDDQELPPDLH